jgi:hypothetical protein
MKIYGTIESLMPEHRSVLLNKYYPGDSNKKNVIGGACSAYGGAGELHSGFWWGNLRERAYLADLGWSITLKWISSN